MLFLFLEYFPIIFANRFYRGRIFLSVHDPVTPQNFRPYFRQEHRPVTKISAGSGKHAYSIAEFLSMYAPDPAQIFVIHLLICLSLRTKILRGDRFS